MSRGEAGDGVEHLDATLVVPLRVERRVDDELVEHLRRLARHLEVVVVDGSPPRVAAATHRRLIPQVRHVPPDPDLLTANGKVGGVLTGLRRAGHDAVVVADDDVRHGIGTLHRLVTALDRADVVVPANHFRPRPWHARWDTARTLCNRAVGHDLPGTVAVRRRTLLEHAGGYDGDVLFENLELLRTVRAVGGVVRHRPDIHVVRRPPTTRHFLGQRVRQAYDETARPWRLAGFLALAPLTIAVARRRPAATAAAWALAPTAFAEVGRRRHHGRAVHPATAPLWAPAWVAERAICSWLAVARWACGGVRYRGVRLQRAATPLPALCRKLSGRR